MGPGRKTELVSYSGQVVWGEQVVVRDRTSLSQVLREALAKGRKVSIRGGGMAFDTHALNEDLVVQLEGFDRIGEVRDGKIVVEANARWDAILERTKAAGYLPYVMVSTERATAGGTLATDALSRFSPTCGKEGNHIESFVLMTLDGRIHRCARDENQELFRAAISGFGWIGVVLEIEHRLMEVGFSNIRVETKFKRFEGLADLAESLVTEVEEVRGLRPEDIAPTKLEVRQSVKLEDAHAISAVVYMNERRQGFVMRSRYVDGDEHALDPSPFHQPKSLVQRMLQVLAFFELPRLVGYWYVMERYLPKHSKAIDELEGFTFFQGGNDAVRRFGRGLGLPMGIRQQTFVIPRNPEDIPGTKARLARFLEGVDAKLDAAGVLPPLIDVLYLPDDADEGFVLSSSRGGSGYAVTLTFEEMFRASFSDEDRLLAEISVMAEAEGGRVHLVKNVMVDPERLARMYAQGIADLAAVRARVDPRRTLTNAFLRRIAPSLG